ncbi:MAG: transglutaminase domain-containing protein [Planctomycetota bacterium]|nr:transglutaminase domain-containing protein [Planctomycetota bacterium]MEE3284797.1 transglutaminase domain-containing protein [Planctomycetota bacterium]
MRSVRSITMLATFVFVSTLAAGCRPDDIGSTSPRVAPSSPAAHTTPRTRSFELDYGVTIKEIPGEARLRVWFPVPQTARAQTATRLSVDGPVEPRQTTESKYGNQMLYFEHEPTTSDPLTFRVTWHITRNEVRGLQNSDPRSQLDKSKRELFLAANLKVPINGKPLTLLDSQPLPRDEPLELARALYERVDAHMRYDKSQPGYGNGDVLWACDSGFGNCTDFHSLFISLARAHDLPARFEIGFPLPPERGHGSIGGYHCWAQFHVDGRGWIPADISEADKHPELRTYYYGNLTENRVQFTVGRDIVLEPAQDGAPLNYFIYPHIEVDGKTWPIEKTERHFAFRDSEPG